MYNTIEIIYFFQRNKAALWVEGDKLKVMAPTTALSEELKKDLSENKESLCAYLKENNIFSANDFITKPIMMFCNKDQENPRLSFAQERLWFIDRYEQGTYAYNTSISLHLNHHVSLPAFYKSLNAIVQRQQVLRTVIRIDKKDQKSYQQVLDVELTVEERTYINQSTLDQQLLEDSRYIFNLEKEIPIKVCLYHYEDKENAYFLSRPNYLLINIHHIAFDGWSVEILLKELNSYYHHYTKNCRLDLPDLKLQYKDFSEWQREYLSGEILENQLQYWTNQLAGFERLEFPIDKPRPNQIDYNGRNISFKIDTGRTKLLKDISRRQGVSLYTTLLTIFNILLFKYTHQEDIVIGTPVANRHYVQLENLIGFFINSLVIRTKLNSNQKIEDLIQTIHHYLVGAHQYQDLPFEKLAEQLHVEKSTNQHPIFQVMFGVQSFGNKEEEDEAERLYDLYVPPTQYYAAKFDFSLFVDDSKEELCCYLNYAVSLFQESTIFNLAKHYDHLIKQITSYEKVGELKWKTIEELNIITEEECQQWIYDYNKTDTLYQKNKSIHALFEEQVVKIPNNIAVIFENRELTYRELDEISNQLARYIQIQYKKVTGKTFEANTLTLLLLERGHEMIIAILAVLKAGGAYVPIDPNYPDERIRYILEDTQADILLTQNHFKKKLENIISTLCIITLEDKPYKKESTEKIESSNKATDLAYVIYTSGSTGKPKGVLIEHQTVMNTISAQINDFQINESSRLLQFASISFDAAVSEIATILLAGGTLVLAKQAALLPGESLQNTLKEKAISVVTLPPAALAITDPSDLPQLKTIVSAGDICPITIANLWSKGRLFVNAYGPTEASICATMYAYNINEPQKLNIGKPFFNVKVYILDKALKPVPVGVRGELYIGGAGVARGYLNQPELTEERFIKNPFATMEDKANGYTRLYRTGDIVKWLSDGNIEYVGRNDFQVKMRGFRIELGEIETLLLSHPEIQQVCVLARERAINNDKYLLAYYVSEQCIEENILAEYLKQYLPDYMMPSMFIWMASFPLTINGKLDRNALPDLNLSLNERNYVAPRTELERKLSDIWKSSLGLERVSIEDDFFRVGGDSILSIQLSSKVRAIGFNCNVKDIFDYRTIKQLANFLLEMKEVVVINAEQEILTGSFNLLPIQSWFFEQVKKNKFKAYDHWNQSFLIKVPKLNLERLSDVIKQLVTHHDALRLSYSNWKEQNQQSYLKTIDIPPLNVLDVSELSDIAIHQTLTKWQSDFDLEKGPLWRIGYLYGYEDGTARIYFSLHHLIVDAVSWRILIEDIKTLYEDKILEKKSSSYRQWVKVVGEYAKTHIEKCQYWENQTQHLPDYHQYDLQRVESSSEIFQLEKVMTDRLLQEANAAYHTEINDLLLTALGYALQDLIGGSIQGLTLEGHGRELIDETIDVGRTVGWFTTAYPVKFELQKDLSQSIKYIKEALRNIPNKGIGYGALRYHEEKLLESNALPPIGFNYLGQFDTQDGLWQIVPEDSGVGMHSDNAESNIININGMVIAGKLQFHILTQLGKKTTQTLTNTFKAHLIQVIEHCVEKVRKKEEEYTTSDFETVNISQTLLEKIEQSAKALNTKIEAIYPANSLQQGFIYHSLSQPKDDAYRVQILFDYKQALNIEHYTQAWALAIKTYPILRTGFNWEEEIIQITYHAAELEYYYHDISHLVNQSEREAAIDKIQKEDREKAFDLSKPALLRLHIIKQNEAHYTLLKSEHHSIADGWSGPVLLTKVHDYYESLEKNERILIEEDQTYLEAQAYYAKKKQGVVSYWNEQIKQLDQVNDLNPLLSKSVDLDQVKSIHHAGEISLTLEGQAYQQLKSMIQIEGLTLNVLVQFAWHKLIQLYTQDTQTIVGTTISGRGIPISGVEESVGLYINTLPLIINWNNKNTVRLQLQAIHENITHLNTHGFVNLSSLQKEGRRLFHSLLAFENYPMPEQKQESETRLTPIFRRAIEKLDYPLGLIAYEMDDGLYLQLKYDGDLLNESLAKQYLAKLEFILTSLPKKLNEAQESISLLTDEERQQIVYEWNETDEIFPHDKTLTQLFEEQVKKTPDNVALVFEGEELTYRVLNERSNQLARYIRKQYQNKTNKALPPDTLITLCLERNFEMIIGILGVLKAGGAYVPIDPAYPDERIVYLLNDTKTQVMLTQTSLKEKLESLDKKVCLITLDNIPYQKESAEKLEPYSQATDLAYVIYTSGTTGQPKGVALSHEGIVNRITWMQEKYPLFVGDKVLHKTPYVFDVSVWELFWANWYGASIVIAKPDGHRDSHYLLDLIQKEKITHLHFVPSMLEAFNHALNKENKQAIGSIRHLFCSGEALTTALSDKTYQAFQSQTLSIHNLYGPTEASIDVSYFDCQQSHEVYLGKPIQNIKLYILDKALNPLPQGVLGELYIGGVGLAREYLNQPELTKERFIQNPFSTEKDKEKGYTRLYKTGDVVRWLSDGNIEYIGRNDFQVKLRGFRIELAEIENAVSCYPGVKQACILVKDNQSLVAYYVADQAMEDNDLITHLSQRLAHYMIPSLFVWMNMFPLTVSGKLDRKMLPNPNFIRDETHFVSPRTELEKELCRIWESVLGIEKISIKDDFFKLGGSSILAIKLTHKMSSQLNIKIQVADIFSYRNIYTLTTLLEEDNNSKELEF